MILTPQQAASVVNGDNVVGTVIDEEIEYYIINNEKLQRTDHVVKEEMDEYAEEVENFPWYLKYCLSHEA